MTSLRETRRVKPWLVSIFILKEDVHGTRVLLLKRVANPPGIWCQVAGKIEPGETASQAALREVQEEIGLVPDRFFSADIGEQFYEPGMDEIVIAPVFVAWVTSDLVTLNEEHSEYAWVDFDKADAMLSFPGQRKILRHIKEAAVDRPLSQLLEISLRS